MKFFQKPFPPSFCSLLGVSKSTSQQKTKAFIDTDETVCAIHL